VRNAKDMAVTPSEAVEDVPSSWAGLLSHKWPSQQCLARTKHCPSLLTVILQSSAF